MGEKGGLWDISIQGGLVHFKHILIPGRQYPDKPRMHDIIPVPLLIPCGTFTVKNHQVLLRKHVLRQEGNIYVVLGLCDPIALYTKCPPF